MSAPAFEPPAFEPPGLEPSAFEPSAFEPSGLGPSRAGALGALHVEPLELPGGGRALFTSRAHGNMSSVGGERAEHGVGARERLREALGVRCLVRGYQVHGRVVGRVPPDGRGGGSAGRGRVAAGKGRVAAGKGEAGAHLHRDDTAFHRDSAQQPRFEADGHAVGARGVAAMVLAADCLPVVLGADGGVAALHAGWRGLAAGVLEEGVRALREVGGVGEVTALVGPCAGVCCYEVGEEVHAAFAGAHREGGRIDLRVIAHERLLAAGVARVLDVRACTICDERYFSHRREGARAGRQAGVAWLGV
jgi:polyphenol oxidase